MSVALTSEQSQLAAQNLDLVHVIVNVMIPSLPAFISRDDLISFGSLGLVKAAQNFDPTRQEASFRGYASHRVKGEIQDQLRSQDHLGRSVRSNFTVIDKSRSELESNGMRNVSAEQIAQHSGLSIQQVKNALKTPRHVVSLDAASSDGWDTQDLSSYSSPEELYIGTETSLALNSCVAALDDTSRKAVMAHYVCAGNTLAAARMLNIAPHQARSAMRVAAAYVARAHRSESHQDRRGPVRITDEEYDRYIQRADMFRAKPDKMRELFDADLESMRPESAEDQPIDRRAS